ncbi:DUF2752 domain-containing protein [Aestuariibaculum suncheonense]|uniref:DUF2752 domain-containing protein n=2 Tax=Aestuariibaculum suncheonense TaxID=1028745 RepID=A0A8J6UKI6_9FLAO|nr:DUF2752 domain-containing protein [Aestuariibaculum suncheonense]
MIVVIIVAGLLSLYFFYNPLEFNFFPKCPFYSITSLFCPGCGSQRSIHQILHGNVTTGIRHNYLIFLLCIVLGYQLYILVLKMNQRAVNKNILHKSITTKIILVIVVLFWILRNINIFPFTELAP